MEIPQQIKTIVGSRYQFDVIIQNLKFKNMKGQQIANTEIVVDSENELEDPMEQ